MVPLSTVANNDENERLAIALQKQKDRHRLFKRRFLSNLSKLGLLMETVCLNDIVENKLICFVKGCS
jgi:hypothetical protein